ncbi:MAG: Nif11-like leader peptide family natural product precursor [Rhodospirillaceae bacterium]|jgi:predicted ribosomally synthesized peptide with nif11-like leader|nr:Nif11-like leader peptide family natural product precursor [Rhodospirillaceae bacterium]MBT3808200.1 Nif11-like leader peptide family natural product precursor [Rhodospirillaceae bacterium]MBT3931388.1 Nif11-like leader peptide family natural product precursor [Rhodospirillaceae bacterium]MBT4773365.1 Nif11-like leader peptide family natural product precursor [Rhodospirillaceae bacterium]MBT5359977.1 Nif11-like leader peptide family natural product precursor [Rhodospirillaceae bacterium]
MSNAEVERFVADLKSNDGLRSELSGHASGVGSVVAFAKDKGYDIEADEAAAYIHGQAGRELNDDELDAVAGGKGNETSTSQTSVATEVSAAAAAIAVIVLT